MAEFGCRSPGCLAPQLASEIDFAFRKLCGERGNPEAFKTGKRGNPELVFQPGPISGGLPGPVWNGSEGAATWGPQAYSHLSAAGASPLGSRRGRLVSCGREQSKDHQAEKEASNDGYNKEPDGT